MLHGHDDETWLVMPGDDYRCNGDRFEKIAGIHCGSRRSLETLSWSMIQI
ncbi:hypothetical protein KRIGEM_03077 (plasmid) [Komagataeibacter rhaeticus]|nr:hypothetical protein KRIGEM_03138 [Komagataeibacter rhaeticus]SAY50088.1 hypothetical protein KRIGEM_03077 [Komagataeibacter rhaeticus]